MTHVLTSSLSQIYGKNVFGKNLEIMGYSGFMTFFSLIFWIDQGKMYDNHRTCVKIYLSATKMKVVNVRTMKIISPKKNQSQ